MPRIIAGAAKGRPLAVPPRGTRPTSDRAREGLFSALEARLGSWAGLAVLDLYAGSGALGLEALSRGASRAVFVESAPQALRVLRGNVATLGLPGASVIPVKVAAHLAIGPGAEPYDVVFLDPPYDLPTDQVQEVVARLSSLGWLAAEATVVVERSSREAPWSWPEGLEPLADRTYGEATLWYGHAPS